MYGSNFNANVLGTHEHSGFGITHAAVCGKTIILGPAISMVWYMQRGGYLPSRFASLC